MDSVRFPGKVLWKFLDMPMIEHVYRRACIALDSKDVYITTSDAAIISHMKSIDANVIISSQQHNDGTSRAAEAAGTLNYDFIVVLQADEILIDPDHLIQLINDIKTNPEIKFWNLVTSLDSESELHDGNIVKCTLNVNGDVMFIFRQNPFNGFNHKIFKKIMGTIAFEHESLKSLVALPDTTYQIANSTEQLKILEYGNRLHGLIVENSYPSTNLISDISIVKKLSEESLSQIKILKQYVS
jgi:3-deoxy-manno-octulosonate cytidylyltransferase (CMP-KDO synthetase)